MSETGYFSRIIFFDCEKSPTFDQVVELLINKSSEESKMEEEHPEWEPFMFEDKECLFTLNRISNLDDWPVVGVNNIVSENCFVENLPVLGRQPITMNVVEVNKL